MLIVLQEGSSSVRHRITDVRARRDKNGALMGWNIEVKSSSPENVTDDMAQWHIFLEVQMGNVIRKENAVWLNGELMVRPRE